MPLHLLGKKSWNVYNAENVERVRRDEAEAAARVAAAEQHMQEIDAERRMRILRGLPVDDLPEPSEIEASKASALENRPRGNAEGYATGRESKRRRLAGEDDTDRDLRLAKARQHDNESRTNRRQDQRDDPPLIDSQGHISLIAPPPSASRASSSTKQSPGQPKQTLKSQDPDTFEASVGTAPWYASGASAAGASVAEAAAVAVTAATKGKNVWGRDDPRREQRQERRLATEDPLAAMQRGVAGKRAADRDRKAWQTEQKHAIQAEIEAEAAEHRERRRRRRRAREKESANERQRHYHDHHRYGSKHRHDSRSRSKEPADDDSLENFRLDDAQSLPKQQTEDGHRSHRRHHYEDEHEHTRRQSTFVHREQEERRPSEHRHHDKYDIGKHHRHHGKS